MGRIEREVKVRKGENLLLALRRAGASVPSLCGGRGACGKCVVRVKGVLGRLNEPSGEELRKIGPSVEEGWRLACSTYALEDSLVKLELAEISAGAYIATGLEPKLPQEPAVEVVKFSIDPKAVEPLDALVLKRTGAVSLSIGALRKLGSGVFEGLAYVYNGEILDVRPGGGCYGVAVDIGTTKIAGQLVDLSTGETLSFDFVENPQQTYGGDLISRIKAIIDGTTTVEELHEITIGSINNLVRKLVAIGGVDKQEVLALSIVGNSVMEHLALGVSPIRVSSSPYAPVHSTPLEVKAKELGVEVNEEAIVLVFPNVSGFVGGDVVADIITAAYLGLDEPSLLVDIGTNSEVVLFADGKIYVSSAPAGSAIEGVGLSSGIHAVQGAVDSVYVDEGLGVEYTTIGGGKAVGITGSGYVDLIAWLIRRGVLDRSGRLKVDVFTVVKGEETANGRPLVLTRRDVRLIQQAKAAVSSAWRALLRVAGVKEEGLVRVFVAGSFGFRLNRENVVEIGLLPRVPLDKVVYLGNSAVIGAKIVLKYRRAWRELIPSILKRIVHVELSLLEDYQEIFVDSLKFY